MRRGSKPAIGVGRRMIIPCLLGSGMAHGQALPQQKPQMAEELFKNVQVLKGIPVNEFLGIMGFFAASLGKSCVDCHNSDSGWENYVADTNPNKRTARAMIRMAAEINKSYFGGRAGRRPRRCGRARSAINSLLPSLLPDRTLERGRRFREPGRVDWSVGLDFIQFERLPAIEPRHGPAKRQLDARNLPVIRRTAGPG